MKLLTFLIAHIFNRSTPTDPSLEEPLAAGRLDHVGSIYSLDYNSKFAIRLGQFLVAPVARMMELEPWTRCARSNSVGNVGRD